MVSVEKVTETRLLGEGPHWDHERQHLYYVDSFTNSIHRYIPSEHRDTACKVDDSAVVSIVIPVKDTTDKFLATIHNNLSIVTWDGESTRPQNVELITTLDEGNKFNRFNDGKVDPTGRLWVGTLQFDPENMKFGEGAGALYSFPKGKKPVKHFGGLTIANGMAWSKDLKSMYFVDTPTKRVDVLDFDAANGVVANRRTLIDLQNEIPGGGGPDGMTIDTDDNLWVAIFGEAAVFHIDTKKGKLIRKIEIPSKQTTSVAFGGPNLDELYVVSARFNLTSKELEEFPEAGATFKVTGLGVQGYPGLPAEF